MPPADPLILLLANEQAEEIKLTTMTMRGFYPGCRVEAVYSAEEALEWASKQDWHVILLDEQLPSQSERDVLPELRRRAPNAAIIVQAERSDAAMAVQVMRDGADYYLFKKSVTFLSELPLVTKVVLESRDLRTRLALAQDRYHRLIETLTDVVYELDAEGRFIYVSPTVVSLLGYTPQELVGTHYLKLFPPHERGPSERQFNERRAAERATRHVELQLVPKSGTQFKVIPVEINATGLYNPQQQFLGTVGVLRGVPARKSAPSPSPSADPNHPSSTSTASPGTSQLRQPETKSPLQESRSLSGLERRRSPRVNLQMDARLSMSGAAWNGTALNINLGGIFLVFDETVSVSENQPIQLGLTSEVGVLEIHGMVCRVNEVASQQIMTQGIPALGVAVEFTPLEATDELILASLLDGLRDRSITVTLTAIMPPKETGDLLLEVSSAGTTDQVNTLHSGFTDLERFSPLSNKEKRSREIDPEQRLESDRPRAWYQLADAESTESWRDFLLNSRRIENDSTYWHLMDHIHRLMGSFGKGERILDAGCGNGDFGSFLLLHEAYEPNNTPRVDAKPKPPHYVGIHPVSSVLAQARYNLGKLAAEIRGLIAPTGIPQPPLIRASFSLVDLNRPLPFRDNQFDRIVCNLVIGYLQEPLFSLRELMRILSPNGKVVVTSLKPQTELSEIYQGLTKTIERSECIKGAMRLLSNWGKVKQGESREFFHFFDRQELAMLLTSSGLVCPRIYSTFANQAYIAVAEKPAS